MNLIKIIKIIIKLMIIFDCSSTVIRVKTGW